ncbi:rod shape-determining protein MreD [Oligoflexia bacterium]|nr:rod shape-determining protein MreD [Oligoflexia bacterium]
MTKVRYILLLLLFSLVGIFVQETLLSSILLPYLVPNFLLIIVVFLAYYEASAFGACLAFMVGLIYDVSSGVVLGPWAASFVLVFAVFCSLSQRVFLESYLAAFLAVFLSTMLCNGAYIALVGGFGVETSVMFSVSLIEGVVSGLLAPFVLKAFKKLLLGKDLTSASAY